jgi:hypothetical protein
MKATRVVRWESARAAVRLVRVREEYFAGLGKSV